MIEYKFKTVLELKQALNNYPDNALVEISELSEKLSKHGLSTVFNGEKVLICEFHDYEKEDKKEEFLKIEELDFTENVYDCRSIAITGFPCPPDKEINFYQSVGKKVRSLLNLGVKDIKVSIQDDSYLAIEDWGIVISYSNKSESIDFEDVSSDDDDLFYFFESMKSDEIIGQEISKKTVKYRPEIIIKTESKYPIKRSPHHPGKLCAIWYDLPVSGICIETGKQVNFFFGNILWDMEGVVDGGIPVYINKNGEIKDVIVHQQSLTLFFPEKPEEMTPLQKLALFALPFSHWKPENANNSQPEIQS